MYTIGQIAGATGAPYDNVRLNWPVLSAALTAYKINTHLVRIGVIATVARETGIFQPIEEEDGGDPTYFIRELGAAEAAYHGRGYVQITWSSNYSLYGALLGIDLLHDPALALDPVVAANILCEYFIQRGIPAMCEAQNWGGVQVAVNGGWVNWPIFIGVVDALLKIPEPSDDPPVTTVSQAGDLHTTPVANGPLAIDPARMPIHLPVGQRVTFGPDPHTKLEVTPHWAHIFITGTPEHGWYRRDHLQTVFP